VRDVESVRVDSVSGRTLLMEPTFRDRGHPETADQNPRWSLDGLRAGQGPGPAPLV